MSLSSVLPGSYFGDAVSQNGYGFEYLGKLYLFTFRGEDDTGAIDNHFRCMQSSDGGATWVEMGAGPQWPSAVGDPLNNGFAVAYSVARDGANAILVWVNATRLDPTHLDWGSFTISKAVFNLTTSTWGSTSTTSAPFMGMMDTADQSPTWDHGNRTSIYLIVRGPGNYLVYVPGVQSGASPSLRATATVVPYNGSAFGGALPIPGQVSGKWYMPCGSVYDPASGNTHLLMAGGLLAGGIPNVYHVTMDSGNNYGSLSMVIDSSVSPGYINAGVNTGPDGVSQPIIYTDGTTRKIGILSSVFGASTGFVIYVRFFSAVEALNPTFTHVEVTTDMSVVPQAIPTFSAHAEMFCLAANSTTLIATWISFNGAENQPSDIYYSTSPVTGTPVWSTPLSIIPTPSSITGVGGPRYYVNVQGLAFPVTGGFGIFGTAQLDGVYTPSFVSKFNFVAAAGPPPPPGVTCGSPPDGNVGTAYSHTMPNTHTGAFTVAVTAGGLPPGLTMNTSGLITGTPTVAGSFAYTATITDSVGTGTVDCTITINASSLGLGCASPPDGVVGTPYFHIFPVSGGTPPYTFAIISGILPPGLTLDSLHGQVSGTPTLAGDYEFVIQVSDGFGSTVGTCDIVITVTDLPASGIGCDSPPEGEIGVAYSHTFPVTDIPEGATVVYSITGGALPPGLTLNTATGQVTGTPTTDGHYHFTVTATIT